jgi:hypothetical protein
VIELILFSSIPGAAPIGVIWLPSDHFPAASAVCCVPTPLRDSGRFYLDREDGQRLMIDLKPLASRSWRAFVAV